MENEEAKLVPRPVSDSKSEMIELVLPNDANPLGALLGGRLMHWIDLAGALAAHRHSHSYVVTASMDHIDFLIPVHVGDMVLLQSSINRVFKTSMEVGVKVSVENYISATRQKVAKAYLTFVAVDRHGRRLPVAPVIPETFGSCYSCKFVFISESDCPKLWRKVDAAGPPDRPFRHARHLSLAVECSTEGSRRGQ